MKKAFTLIELLVVIAIIALLMSILMPSLAKVKELARVSVCSSNLRQLSLASVLYAQDYEDWLPPVNHDQAGQYWFHQISPYMGDNNYQEYAADGNSDVQSLYDGPMKTAFCPNARKISNTGIGSASEAWEFPSTWGFGAGSYGMNLWTSKHKGSSWEEHPALPAENYFGKVSSIKGDVPLYGDCTWVGGWPKDSETPPTDLQAGGEGEVYLPRFCIDRHSMKICITHVDTSVSPVKLPELWSLKWNKNFDTKRVSPEDVMAYWRDKNVEF